jgi:hypothetical protein
MDGADCFGGIRWVVPDEGRTSRFDEADQFELGHRAGDVEVAKVASASPRSYSFPP